MNILRPVLSLLSLGLIGHAPAATFTVTSTNDSGPGSLRQAVADANAAPGADAIHFNIPPGGPQTIVLSGFWLELTDPVTIDGTSQPGFAGRPIVTVAAGWEPNAGFSIVTSNCVVRGLVLSNFFNWGVYLHDGARGNVIGGTNAGHGNVIAFNGNSGVLVAGGTNNAIRGNAIFGNGLLGIDLGNEAGDDGVTANDNKDPDTGPNQRQNFPVLSSATISASGLAVSGNLNSLPNTTFQLDFFVNRVCDASGSGEAETYLGTSSVTTGGNGTRNFSANFPGPIPGRYITATATDPSGNTSEFSPCERATSTVPPATFTVTNTSDGGPGSLRQAILDANDRLASAANTIAFAIPGGGVKTIAPWSPLPAITEPVVLDGYTQPGASANTLSNGFNANLLIRLDGLQAGRTAGGLRVLAGGSAIRGLLIVRFYGHRIELAGSGGNLVTGCNAGFDPADPDQEIFGDWYGSGVAIINSADNIVGGTTPAARNALTLNGGNGVLIAGAGSSGNQVLGNFLGAGDLFTFAGNRGAGVFIDGASSNAVGGTVAGARNVICANYDGVVIANFGASNRVQGNFIGVDAVGTGPLGNTYAGVFVSYAPDNLIGGTTAAARNVISANGSLGVAVFAAESPNNVIQGNFIGTDASGGIALGNDTGVFLATVPATLVGGTVAGAGNLISGNRNPGVVIIDGVSNRVQGNLIGCAAGGIHPLPNGTSGIGLSYSRDNLIGGTTPAARNVICANGGDGVTLFGDSCSNNLVQGNFIGTDASGARARGNGSHGVHLMQLASGNTIGGAVSGATNVIAFNGSVGVAVEGVAPEGEPAAATSRNAILRNAIFGNGVLGIDLGGDHVTGSDPDDSDFGPNQLQNHPELSEALRYSNRTVVQGALRSRPATSYRLEFFDNEVCDDSGHGEGRYYLGTLNVTTAGSGQAAFTFTYNTPLTAGHFITATATDPDNNTSEFSACQRVVPFDSADVAVQLADSPDGVSLLSNVVYVITVTSAGPTNATGVVVTDRLPSGVSFVSAAPSQGSCSNAAGLVTCRLGALNRGAVATITVTGRPLAAEQVENVVSVSADQTDPVMENNSASEYTALGLADLSLGFAVSPPSVVAGQLQTNLLTVVNDGPDTSPAPWLVFWTEPSFQVLSAVSSQGNLEVDGALILGQLGPMPPGRTVAITIVYVPTAQGEFTLSAEARQNVTDLDPANNVASATASVTPGRGVLMFSSAGVSGRKGRRAVLSVIRTGGSEGALEVSYATADGSATAPGDYAATSGTLRFAPFEDVQTLVIPLASDGLLECGETFTVYLHSPTGGAVLAGRTNTVVTILDPDLVARGVVTPISASTNGPLMTGDAASFGASLSHDGRWAAFVSGASDLASGHTPLFGDVYVRDLLAGTNALVSRHRPGAGHVGSDLISAVISADGSHVAFAGYSRDLVAVDSGPFLNIFVRNLAANTTALVSVNAQNSGGGDADSLEYGISSNGLAVAFTSYASDLTALPTSNELNVFVCDLGAGTTRLASVNQSGTTGGNGVSDYPVISANGRCVAFESSASDLAPDDHNGEFDLFVFDRVAGTVTLASVNAAGTGSGNGESRCAALSADGRFLAFSSNARDLTPDDTRGTINVFWRDLVLGVTRLVSVHLPQPVHGDLDSGPPSISADGRYVAFSSYAMDLVPGQSDSQALEQVYVRDVTAGVTRLASVQCDGSGRGTGYSTIPRLSADGRFVAFESTARDLIPLAPEETPEFVPHVYRRDLAAEKTELVSVNWGLTGAGYAQSGLNGISGDGVVVAFSSPASNLTPSDQNQVDDAFVWRALPSGSNALLRLSSAAACPPGLVGCVIAVTNLGPDAAANVVVTCPLPAGTTFAGAVSTSGACSPAGGIVTCQLGALPRRGGAVITVLALPMAEGHVTFTASVMSATPDALLADNTASVTTTATLPPPATLAIASCGGLVALSWQANPAGFVLECAPTLNAPIPWTPITTGVADNGVVKALVSPNDGSAPMRFYRLRAP